MVRMATTRIITRIDVEASVVATAGTIRHQVTKIHLVIFYGEAGAGDQAGRITEPAINTRARVIRRSSRE